MNELESAANPERLRRVAIDPVSRVEGHGKVTLLVDDDNVVQQARLHIVEFRGFERFIQGRPYWELPVIVQRLCGICPVSHHLAAGKAIDQVVGAASLTPAALKLRRMLHFGQTLQSHALHFFHLASPDLLFGFGSDLAKRNILGVLADYPDVARMGVLLRKYGQEVIRVLAGKRVHGVQVVPGGVNKALAPEERAYLRKDSDQVVAWAQEAVELSRRLFLANDQTHRRFAAIDTHLLSLVGPDGELELYDGRLRGRRRDGELLFDQVPDNQYRQLLTEQVKPWSYMKFPYFTALGEEQGWYRVGPLARIVNCDRISTPLAEQARQAFLQEIPRQGARATLAYHWARMIELLHCAEALRDALGDPELGSADLVAEAGTGSPEVFGVIEAPRGTLFHHYQVGEDGLVEKANLIVSTTSNNQAMNESVRQVAADHLSGKEITEGLLNHIEVAIRAYDPCHSCATHALGKMPLEVRLEHLDGELIHRYRRQ